MSTEELPAQRSRTVDGTAVRGRLRPGKRLFDITVAAVLLCLLLPLLVTVALLVSFTSPGSPVFRQVRTGRHGRTFVMYKFRTMYADADDEIHRAYVHKLLTDAEPPKGGERGLYKLDADPRVTRVGAFLRRSSLDELPQLVNVVLGQMSLVGPRPALPWETELFPPEYAERFSVRPGLTGLWQVSGRSRLTMRAGLALDVEYVRRQGIALDLTVLAKTVHTVFRASEAS